MEFREINCVDCTVHYIQQIYCIQKIVDSIMTHSLMTIAQRILRFPADYDRIRPEVVEFTDRLEDCRKQFMN